MTFTIKTDGTGEFPAGTEAPPQEDHSGDIAIVYPVSWPAPTKDVPEPHCTLIYLGDISDATFTLEDLQDAVDTFIWEPFDVAIGEVQMFGPDEDIPVVTLLGQTLYDNRQIFEAELNERGIKSASEYDYSPHITVDPRSMVAMPFNTVHLGLPKIWWGDQRV